MQNAEPVQLRQVRDFGQLISTTFTFLKQNWKPLVRAMALVCLPAAVIGGFLAVVPSLASSRCSSHSDRIHSRHWSRWGKGCSAGHSRLPAPDVRLAARGRHRARISCAPITWANTTASAAGDTRETGLLANGILFRVRVSSSVCLSVSGSLLCILPGFYAYTVLCLDHLAMPSSAPAVPVRSGPFQPIGQGDFWPTLGLVIVIGLINGHGELHRATPLHDRRHGGWLQSLDWTLCRTEARWACPDGSVSSLPSPLPCNGASKCSPIPSWPYVMGLKYFQPCGGRRKAWVYARRSQASSKRERMLRWLSFFLCLLLCVRRGQRLRAQDSIARRRRHGRAPSVR